MKCLICLTGALDTNRRLVFKYFNLNEEWKHHRNYCEHKANFEGSNRLITSVPVSASFIELDAATVLHLGLIIKLTENPAKIAAKMARPIRLQELLLVI